MLMILNITKKLKVLETVFVITVLVFTPILFANKSYASQILNRKLTLSSSLGGASNVSYAFSTSSSLPTTTTPVKSVDIKFCESLADGCISTPDGFSSSTSTLASQPTGLGAASGWTVDNSSAGFLRIVNASNSTNPSGNVSIVWDGVHNPTASNTTFYAIVTTYSNADWTGAIDSGSLALSTSGELQVTFTVDETLTFCTGTSITGQNCGTISGSTVSLGRGSSIATSTGTSVMAAATNGSTGYSITVNGQTLTSGSDSIDAMSTGGASIIGNEQFGINLAGNNVTPAVGASVSGSGSAVAETGYNTNDNFKFVDGETIASASGPTNANTFTISYIANIAGSTPAGTYTTNLNYIATANF
jgi:hypothetical protein